MESPLPRPMKVFKEMSAFKIGVREPAQATVAFGSV